MRYSLLFVFDPFSLFTDTLCMRVILVLTEFFFLFHSIIGIWCRRKWTKSMSICGNVRRERVLRQKRGGSLPHLLCTTCSFPIWWRSTRGSSPEFSCVRPPMRQWKNYSNGSLLLLRLLQVNPTPTRTSSSTAWALFIGKDCTLVIVGVSESCTWCMICSCRSSLSSFLAGCMADPFVFVNSLLN